jgi:hypothetical protein
MAMKRWITIIWSHLPAQFAENLVASMKRRLQALMEAQGDYTIY